MKARRRPLVAIALGLLLFVSTWAHASPVNVAVRGTAVQSSDYPGAASRAIDGNRDGNWSHGSVTHTRNGDPDPAPQLFEWWKVHLDHDPAPPTQAGANVASVCGEIRRSLSAPARVRRERIAWSPGPGAEYCSARQICDPSVASAAGAHAPDRTQGAARKGE